MLLFQILQEYHVGLTIDGETTIESHFVPDAVDIAVAIAADKNVSMGQEATAWLNDMSMAANKCWGNPVLEPTVTVDLYTVEVFYRAKIFSKLPEILKIQLKERT